MNLARAALFAIINGQQCAIDPSAFNFTPAGIETCGGFYICAPSTGTNYSGGVLTIAAPCQNDRIQRSGFEQP